MRFLIEIKLGNQAMQDGIDVAGALRVVAEKVEDHGQLGTSEFGRIRDLNGNTVGHFEVTGDA